MTSSVLASARRGHRGLYLFAVATAVLSGMLIVAALVDPRTLLGAEVWLKPLKFAVSFAVYAGALSWLLSRLDRVSRAVNVAAWTIVVTSTIELGIITLQAARGQRSHFNDDSELGGMLFAAMGVTVAVLYLAAVGVALAVVRRGGPDRVVTRAVKAGLVTSLLGMAVGLVMIVHGSHAVGVADGGPGMLLTGWSTTGGDLRIGHFLGLHALQVIPLLAAGVVLAGRDRWDEFTQLRLVNVVVSSYLGLVALVTWQALRAEPLTAPGLLTLLVVAAFVVAVALGVRWALGGSAARAVAAAYAELR